MAYLGVIAACLTTVSFLPQAIQVIRTKDTTSISFIMYLMFTTGVFFWAVYGIWLKDISITAANVITFIFASIILFYKFREVRQKSKS
jgi:MtN3 and saliva related transmembrane protein